MPTPDELLLDQIENGSPVDSDEALLNQIEAENPAFTPDAVAAVSAAIGNSSVSLNEAQKLEPLSPNISLVDDFHPRIKAAAQGALKAAGTAKSVQSKIGYGQEDLNAIFRSDDILAHAAGAGLGDVWSVAKNERAKKEWYDTARVRADQFMAAKGYKDIATPEQAAEIQSAFLFGELAWRTPMRKETLNASASHGLKSLIEERRQLAVEHGAVTTEFSNAAAFLSDLTPDEAVQLRGYAASLSSRTPQNEQEELLLQTKPGGAWPYGWSDLGPGGTQKYRFPARSYDALRVLLGTDNPADNLLNHMERIDTTFRAKDLGFVQGDLSRPGVTIPDPRAPGGFSDVALVPPDTLIALERKKNAEGLSSPFDVKATPQNVQALALSTGLPEEAAAPLVEQAAAVEGAKAAQEAGFGQRQDRKVGSETFTSTEWNALSFRNKTLMRMGSVFGPAWEAAQRPFQAWREAQKGGVGEAIAHRAAYTISGDEHVAQQADSLSDVVSVGWGLISQYLDMDQASRAELARLERAKVEGDEFPVVAGRSAAYEELDPSLQAKMFREAGAAVKGWADTKQREAVRQDEVARQSRMSTAERAGWTEQYGRTDYARDLVSSTFHNVYEGLGAAAAQVIDNPEYIPLVVGAEAAGDAVAATAMNGLRRGIEGAFAANGAAQAMRQILRYAPHEVENLRRVAGEKLAAAAKVGNQPEAVAALQNLELHATTLQKEWEAVRQGGAAPSGESIDRVAGLWKAASDTGVDFDDLTNVVQRMQPRGVTANVLAMFRKRFGLPAHLTEDGLRGLSKSYQELANRIQTSLGREPTDIVEATELEKSGTPEAAAKLAELQQGHARTLGISRRLELYSELETMVDAMKRNGQVNNQRFQEIRTQLWGEPDMTDLDFATLIQIDEAKRYAPDGPVGKFIAQRFGYSPDQLKQIKTVGRRILDFSAHDAADLYLAKFSNGVRNMRTNKAYMFAEERVKQHRNELERNYIGKPRDADFEQQDRFLSERLTQLENEHRRATENPVDSEWTLDDQKILMRTISDSDLADLAQTDPLLFGGVGRGDFVTKNPETGADQIVGNEQAALRDMFSTPSLSRQINRFKSLAQGEQLVTLRKAVRSLSAKRGRLEKAMAKSDDPDLIASKLEEVYYKHAEASGELAALRTEIKTNRLRALRDIGELENDASSEVAVKLLEAEIDVLGSSGMPFWAMSRAVHSLPRTTAARQAGWMLRLQDLHTELGELRTILDPKLSAELDVAMRTGKFPDSLPQLKAKFDAVYPTGDDTKWTNLQRFVENAEQFRVGMLEDMVRMGRIDEHLYKELLNKGYFPHRYGIYEASKAIQDKKVQKVRSSLKARTAGQQLGTSGQTLMFERDLFRHRVRIAEADGYIREAKFPNEALARQWVRRNYGADAATTVGDIGDSGFAEGKTASGDKIVLAAPIGDEGIEILGLSTKSPEVLLKTFEDTVRDNHLYLLLNSMRSTGLVISDLEHTTLSNRFGDGAGDFQKQFHRLPNDRRLGNLAGYHVHTKLFSELNNYQHSFEQFRAWLDSLNDVFQSAGASIPEELVNRAPGKAEKLYRPVARIVKNSVILWNAGTWAGGILFNATLSHMVGGDIFAARNIDTWKLAFREIWSDPRVWGGRQRSGLYREFVENGMATGRAFEGSIHEPSVRSVLRALDLDQPEAIKAKVAKYDQLLKDYEQAQLEGKNPKHIDDIKLQLVTLRQVLDHYESGIGRRMMRRLGGFFLNNRNLLQLPNSKIMEVMKNAYGNIDETFKFVNYANLRRKGLSIPEAKFQIEQHFQDYSKVPYAIGASASNPLGALVPSFPWELMRITKNLLKNYPVKTMALMSLVPALNAVSAATSGVDEGRMNAFLTQAGHRNDWERIKSQFTELRLWNPITHEPVATFSLFNLLPFMQITEGRGFLQQAAEHWFPEEERTVGTGLLADALGAVANFAGNNILTNGIGVSVFNRDPQSGQQVLDVQNARPMDYLKAGWRHLGRQFVPRAGLTVLEDLPRALSAPVDPVTGKPVGSPHWTEVLTAQFGVRIKNLHTMFHNKARAQGRKLGEDEALVKSALYGVLERRGPGWLGNPQYGPEQDIRWYTAAIQDPRTSPETRAEYEAEVKKLLHKDREINVLGRKHKLSTTERQEWLAAERIEQRGVPSLYTQATPEEQALILTWVDRAGVRSETIGELINITMRSPNTGQIYAEKDPESMQKALGVLRARLQEPGADGRLTSLVDFWNATQGRAAGLRRKERARSQALKGRQ